MKHIFLVFALVMFAGSAMAQSAKFAASWDTSPVTVEAYAEEDTVNSGFVCNQGSPDGNYCVAAEVEMAKLHIGASKSILVGVSSEIGIHLITYAKGKSGEVTSTAKAEGGVDVTLALVDESDSTNICTIAPDDTVTLMSEMRELSVGATATEGDIEVAVTIDTHSQAAQHFEFLGVECGQGTYVLTATFDLSALAQASGYDASSTATVTLGDRMVTMQEVRAVKGSLLEDS